MASVNGSSLYCTDNFVTVTRYMRLNPRTSVLFGAIPTLIGLDGDQWSNQLFTLKGPSIEITFDFTDVSDYTGVEKIEVVMFNCPQWRIGLYTISILDSSTLDGSRHSQKSCDPASSNRHNSGGGGGSPGKKVNPYDHS